MLPRLLVLTDRLGCARPLLAVLAAAVDGGARAVVVRERDLPVHERAALARAVAALLRPVGGMVIMAGPTAGGAASGWHGHHLAARDARPEPGAGLNGRSCHSTTEVVAAAAEGCSWVTVSPVYPTGSKPGYGPPLGLAGLAAAVAVPQCPPVYALGGLTPDNAAECRAAGAYGGAVMGGIMRAADPQDVVARFVEELAA